jgi:hypothetical protein
VDVFVSAKRFLIFPGATFFEQEIQEAGCAWEHAAAGRTEDVEADCPRAGRECAGFEESGQVAGVVDVQVSKQDGIHLVEIDVQLSDAQEGPGTGVDQDPWCAVYFDDVACSGAAEGTWATGSEHN